MKLALIQMNSRLGDRAANFAHAEDLIRRAAKKNPDVICLPETWNVGFFPKENLAELADRDGEEVRRVIGGLAEELSVNIVAGSAAVRKEDKITNTAFVFDRGGHEIASYDKVHLFSNMKEEESFFAGDRICVFMLDGVSCGLAICYDLRFAEWIRKTALAGIDLLFLPAQWPAARILHWETLARARAIENEIFVCAVNGCGAIGKDGTAEHYGGHSLTVHPDGTVLSEGGSGEEILFADLDFADLSEIRAQIPVLRDRREEIY